MKKSWKIIDVGEGGVNGREVVFQTTSTLMEDSTGGLNGILLLVIKEQKKVQTG